MEDYSNQTLGAMLKGLEGKVDDGFRANSLSHAELKTGMVSMNVDVAENTRHRIITSDIVKKVDLHHDFITKGKAYFAIFTFIVSTIAAALASSIVGLLMR